MRLSDFDYNLPKELIAQTPIKPRDHSRLLLLDRKNGKIEHRHFNEIIKYLNKGDVLVLNNTKVFPARLLGAKKDTGGKIEIFLLKKVKLALTTFIAQKADINEVWQCLIGGHGRKEGLEIIFNKNLSAKIIQAGQDGTWQVRFNKKGKVLEKIINQIGQTPLPPYIKISSKNNKKDYQTVYADDKKPGSVAAPTAGLHFTKSLIKKIKAKGVKVENITLHVGLGTFAPVKVEDITKHKMHSEWAEAKKETMETILRAKSDKHRIIAVGTTTARTLEAVFQDSRFKNLDLRNNFKNSKKNISNFHDWVNIFIYPPYKFKIVDAMVTNFHLPKSTLLMLVSSFAGKELADNAYKQAINKHYRFYSFGDAMFIK